MFFASNWFYTYQYNDVRFNIRTRALNNTLYWLAQVFGAVVFGFVLDFPNIRTTRAKAAWVVMFVLTFAIWGGGYVFQMRYTCKDTSRKDTSRKDTTPDDDSGYDWKFNGYVGPMLLYIFYGFYGAAWQTCVCW